MRIAGTTVAITGAGSGIGRALALAAASRGARIAGLDWNAESMEETAALVRKAGGACLAHCGDVTQPGSAEGFAQAVVAEYGAVDILVNNAGIIQPFIPFSRLTIEQIERVFAVNWWGVVHTTRAFLPRLRERPEARLVNMSSMGGFCPVPGQGVYGASKAAVKLFSEALAAELKRTSVGVTVVLPGAVRTNILANAPDMSEHAKRSQLDASQRSSYGVTAQAAAQAIVRGVEVGAARVLVGADSKILDLVTRVVPERAGPLMAMLMKKAGIDVTDGP
ncbi:MAG: SDR family NAD(P)-dependent oxidoreductase [bacterium]